jgi:hypothetical protein
MRFRVGEADRQEGLHGFLPEEMVDPVELLLTGGREDLAVQDLSRGKIAAEGLLDDRTAEHARAFRQQAGIAEPCDDWTEEVRGYCQVEHCIILRINNKLKLVFGGRILPEPWE